MATGSVSASPKNRNRPAAPTAPNVRAYASSQREDLAMKVCIGVFAAIVLTMALASMSFAQTAPAQPQDPTAQSPASPAPASPASPSAKRPPDEGQKPSEGESSAPARSEEHTSELQSLAYLVCRLLLEKKKKY